MEWKCRLGQSHLGGSSYFTGTVGAFCRWGEDGVAVKHKFIVIGGVFGRGRGVIVHCSIPFGPGFTWLHCSRDSGVVQRPPVQTVPHHPVG